MTLALFAAPFAPTVAIHHMAAIYRQFAQLRDALDFRQATPIHKGPNGRGVVK